MADLAITPADVIVHVIDEVLPLVARYIASESITAGQAVAILNNGDAGLHDATAPEYEKVKGVALNNASIGQPVDIIEAGFVDIGTASTAGEVVVGSHATNGGLAPHSDLVATNPVVIVGFMFTSSILKIDIDNLGVAKG